MSAYRRFYQWVLANYTKEKLAAQYIHAVYRSSEKTAFIASRGLSLDFDEWQEQNDYVARAIHEQVAEVVDANT